MEISLKFAKFSTAFWISNGESLWYEPSAISPLEWMSESLSRSLWSVELFGSRLGNLTRSLLFVFLIEDLLLLLLPEGRGSLLLALRLMFLRLRRASKAVC